MRTNNVRRRIPSTGVRKIGLIMAAQIKGGKLVEFKRFINFSTDLGTITIAEQDGAISDIFWPDNTLLMGAVEEATDLLEKAAKQILEYLCGKRRSFKLPITLSGSPFQQEVLKAVQAIPYGQTRSYRQVAEDVGRPRAARAVGTANRNCRISILVPCHRVIRSNGSLAGDDIENGIRMHLLDLERHFSKRK